MFCREKTNFNAIAEVGAAKVAAASAFAHQVTDWIFDLDNTLYPPYSPLFDQIDRKMTAYIADYLRVDETTARVTQKAYYHKYGTSLRGLMIEHQMPPEPFLAYVHDIDYSAIAPDPPLAAALRRLPGRRWIYTNGSARHAQAVMMRLGVTPLFDGVFDIAAAAFIPKPHGASYDHLIAQCGIDPRQAVLVEDSLKNLPPAAERGMRTVWLCNQRDTAGVGLYDPKACDVVIDDLTAWLQSLDMACGKG